MAYPILAPNSTWYKSSVARSTITEINIVDSYTPTGSENESWNADTGNTGSIKCYRTGTVVTMAGNGSGKIAMNADSSYVFSNSANNRFGNITAINGAEILDTSNANTFYRLFYLCKKLKSVDVSTWQTGNVTNMNGVFNQATALEEISVENWDVSNVTDMTAMFQCAIKLTSLDLSKWDVGRVTNMQNMFMGHSSIGDAAITTIGDVSNWDVSSVTNMTCMFQRCPNLTTLNVSNWDVSNVTDMSYMFNLCTSLTTLDVSKWNVSKVTTMKNMFSQTDYGTVAAPLTELDVSNWDTSSCTDMGWMFYGLTHLTTLDVSKWDVSKVTSFHHMFAWCTQLIPQGVENWDTSSAQYMDAMFHSNLNTSLDLSGWDVSNVKDFAQMFERNIYLTEIKGLEKWNTSSGQVFGEMFYGCQSLKELDLSSFDTRNANDSFYDEQRQAVSESGMNGMFGNRLIGEDKATEEYGWMMRLEKITLGENFSFNGDGTATPAVLPTPDATYISGADGNWYDEDGNPYAVTAIPVGAGTYYAAVCLIDGTYFIRRGTLVGLGDAVRSKTGVTDRMTPDEMIVRINEISIGDGVNITFNNYSVIDDGNGNITITR